MISNSQGIYSSYHWGSLPSSGSGAGEIAPWPEDMQMTYATVSTGVNDAIQEFVDENEDDPMFAAEIYAAHAEV